MAICSLDTPMGLTVKELKILIKDWPEIGKNGESTEVWIETGTNLSSPVTYISMLNSRDEASDIIFESNAFE